MIRGVSRAAEPQLQPTFVEKSAAAAAEGGENFWANSAAAAAGTKANLRKPPLLLKKITEDTSRHRRGPKVDTAKFLGNEHPGYQAKSVTIGGSNHLDKAMLFQWE